MKYKKILAVCSFSLVASALAGLQNYPDVTVTKDDQTGISFTYQVPLQVEREINYQGEKFKIVEIEGCSYSFEAGMPQVPVKIVVLGVPPEGEVTLNYDINPGPEIKGLSFPGAPDSSSETNLPEPQKIARTGYYPQQLVEVEGPMFIRSQRVVRLKIYPLQYNLQTKTTRLVSSFSIQVNFEDARQNLAPLTSPERFDKIFEEALLNYTTAKNWRVEKSWTSTPAQADPFAYSDNWYKINVRDDGLFRIDYTFLQSAGIDPGAIDPRTIRILSGGGRVLPDSNSFPRPDLRELSILVSGGDDGSFDADDYVLFYGWSVDNWEFDTSKSRYVYYKNPYTFDNVYWLTWGGSFPGTPSRWQPKDGGLGAYDRAVTTFKDKIHIENNQMLARDSEGAINDYFNWYWLNQSSFNFFSTLRGVVSSDTAEVRFSSNASAPLPNSVSINGIAPLSVTRDGVAAVCKTLSLQEGSNQLQANYSSSIFLDFYEVHYTRLMDASQNLLAFGNPAFDGLVRYDVSNVNFSNFYLLDLTDKYNVTQIQNYQLNGTTLSFQDSSYSAVKKNYLLLNASQLRRPTAILAATKPNLRDVNEPTNRADLLIISHPDFLNDLQELANFHRSFNNLEVKVVSTEEIYNHFSWGMFDPLAIRDFLKYSYENWSAPRPAYCLLVGDGSYDYKDYSGAGSVNYVPPVYLGNFADDYYIYFGKIGLYDSDSSLGQDRGLDMVISRWPVKSSFDVQNISQKVISYLSQPELGSWKNLVTLVADDEYNPDAGREDENFHTDFTEEIANLYVPADFNLSKIYAIEFPFDVSRRKPSVEDAIVNQVNRGTLLVNYMGHGNPDVWAHENIFRRTQDIPRLNNSRRLPLISTFSCSIGFFDDPNSEAMAEEIMRVVGGGAISVVAATRLVSALSNKFLNDFFFDRLLKNDTLSIAEALYLTKLMRQPISNDRLYVVFGDPLLALAVPQLEARITQINPDTLKAGSLVIFQGEVYDRAGLFQSAYSGEAEVTVFDANQPRTHVMPEGGTINYKMPGSRLFRGKVPVQNGEFSGAFIVPKDVSYGAVDARLSVYLMGNNQDGRGLYDSIPIAGSKDSLVDVTGPQIQIGLADQPGPRDYDFVDPQPILQLTITDSSGINLTGGLGHALTATLDQNQVFEVTDLFQYDPGSYRSGSLTYQLPLLEPGVHEIEVKAWDNLNNSATARLTFQVANLSELVITEVMNYPNPFQDFTNFSYQLSQNADRVSIKIFTLSGKPIKEITNASSQAGYNYATTWDGRDQDGYKVATGVYIYKIVASGKVYKEGQLTNEQKEVHGKLVYQR